MYWIFYFTVIRSIRILFSDALADELSSIKDYNIRKIIISGGFYHETKKIKARFYSDLYDIFLKLNHYELMKKGFTCFLDHENDNDIESIVLKTFRLTLVSAYLNHWSNILNEDKLMPFNTIAEFDLYLELNSKKNSFLKKINFVLTLICDSKFKNNILNNSLLNNFIKEKDIKEKYALYVQFMEIITNKELIKNIFNIEHIFELPNLLDYMGKKIGHNSKFFIIENPHAYNYTENILNAPNSLYTDLVIISSPSFILFNFLNFSGINIAKDMKLFLDQIDLLLKLHTENIKKYADLCRKYMEIEITITEKIYIEGIEETFKFSLTKHHKYLSSNIIDLISKYLVKKCICAKKKTLILLNTTQNE